MKSLRDVVRSDLEFSAEATDFIKNVIDEMFMCDEEEAYCCTTPKNIEIYHLDKFCASKLVGWTCAEYVRSPQYVNFSGSTKFSRHAYKHHMTACVVTTAVGSSLLFRHFDEDKGDDAGVITQWDKMIPPAIERELIQMAESLEAHYNLSSVKLVKANSA